MKSLLQYINEDKPTDWQIKDIKVGTKLNYQGTTLIVSKILDDKDDRPLRFEKPHQDMEMSWENARASCTIMEEKGLLEKKLPSSFKKGDEVEVNGKKGIVKSCDEDYCEVDFNGSTGKFDLSKVKACVQESNSSYFKDCTADFKAGFIHAAKSLIKTKNPKIFDTSKDRWSEEFRNGVWDAVAQFEDGKDLPSIINEDEKVVKESLLYEFITMKRVTVGHSKPGTMKNAGDIVIIRNEDEAIEKIISMMSLPRDGKPKKVGDCFISYDDSHKNIAFYEKEDDIPKAE
jgi:hypothetical protein